MSKKRWYIVPVVAGLLAVAATGGAIFAQGNSGGPGGIRHQGIVTRVAEILGLEESTVRDAFSQAYQERQDAKLQSRLDRLVANDRLTQDEADAISRWYQSKPATDLPLRIFMHRSEESVQQFLNRMVQAERLTQAESEAAMKWYRDKPEALSQLSGHRRPDRGSHGLRFRHGPRRGDNSPATDARFDGGSRSPNPPVTVQGISY